MADFATYCSSKVSFSDYLNEQLGQMKQLDGKTKALCSFLVGCLNSCGYLDGTLSELAEELHLPLFDLEQALFVVQSLEPAGVGARSLSECLLLQLVQSEDFNAVTLRLVRSGLELLAKRDMKALANLLEVSMIETQAAAQAIFRLNPIPSRGFYTESRVPYIVPEATLRCENERIIIELNQSILPKVTLNQEYKALLKQEDCKEAHLYLKEKVTQANALINNMEHRTDTLYRLLTAVVHLQPDYFLQHGNLRPMTMQMVADALDVNVSTISRAVREKYILFNGQMLALRTLFTVPLQGTAQSEPVSAGFVRARIKQMIQAEDTSAPLSDQSLCEALADMNITISRRTVAKYRGELNIPSTSARRQK